MPRRRPTAVNRTLPGMPRYCGDHSPLALGYVAWHEEAARRTERGLKQRRCPDCRLWLWADEWGTHPGHDTAEEATDDDS